MYKMKTVHKSDICSLVIILLFVLVIVQCKVIKSKECRMSGTGDNYRGTHKISSSGRKCKSWNQYYRQLEKKNFSGNNFKEYSRKLASSFCRNPDNNEGGPWCYVFEENSEGAEKEYCDIPFCIEKDCIVYARNNTVYSTIIKLSITAANITFWIKPWHSIEKQKTEARFLFSALPIPSSAKLISHSWKAGIEIVISNTVSGIIFSPKKEFHFEHTPKILSDSKWTGILISYTNGFISARIINSNKLLFQYQSNNKNNILSLYPNNFFFYGLMGTGIMLSTDSCMKSCDVYITFGMEFINIWPLHKQENTYSIFFNVRASHNILIRFYQVPTFAYPCVTIIMNENGRWTLFYQKSEKSLKQTLKIVINSISLNFWSWNAFTISIYGSFLRMYSNNLSIYEEMHVYNILFGSLRWFSIGSEEAISYWTLFCTPEIADVRRDSSPPNCLNNVADSYTGNQWTGAKGQPCVPWISNQIPKNEISVKLFIYHMIIKALNKCRNPSNDPVGPYCYTLPNFSKSYCPIKTCRSLECRVTGTANDYHGTLSVTRSGRVCATWFSKLGNTKLKGIGKAERNSSSSEVLSILRHKNSNFHHERTKRQGHMDEIKENLHFTSGETKKKSVSLMNNLHFNDTHSPQEMQNISNYCRNPSRSIAGTWCFTTDPSVSKDLCNVPDCEKPGKGQGRKLYILPEYRSEGLRFSIKIWDPNKHDSITFVFMADGRSKSRYILKIGAGHNEKVLLYFQTELKALKLVKKKTLSHLMFLGKWSSFILRILHGRLELFYGNTINPLFEWQHPENEKPFSPIYYYHYSELGHTIGITFDCALNCHVENTETNRFTRLLPLLGYNFREYSYPHELQLLLRAKGRIFIPFFLLPSSAQYHLLTMDEFGKIIYFSKYTDKYIKVFHKQISRSLLYNSNHWTNITIRWLNHTISVFSNNTPVFNYIHSSPLLFYYFSLAVSEGGWVTWTTNCIPPDIEGTARDGGWSEWGEWFCSYSCRNGVGARRRICNSPKPNIRGEACLGTSVIMSRCNNIACDDITEAEKHQRFNHMKHYTNYTLNVGTLRNIKLKLRRNHTSIVANEGEMIILYKDYDTIDKVIKESPHSQIKWTQNGLYFLEEQGRKEIMDHNVVVRKCTMQDSGVYTMTIRRIDETQIIIKIISLAIIPVKSSIIIQKGFPIHIMCHCSMLGYVYTDLNIHWSINEKVWMDYGTTLPIAVNNGIILQSNATHNGFWKCIVAQNDLGLQWTTNVLLIKDPPNWRNHLMEDKVTKLIIFAWMSNNGIVAVLLILLLITITCTIAYSKELLQLII